MVHFVHFNCTPGGIEVLIPDLINSLNNHKISAFVIRPCKSLNKSVYNGLGVNVTYGSKSTMSAFFRLVNYGFKHKKDIFHVYNLGPLFLIALHLAGVKNIVYSIHGTKYWKTSFQKLTYKLLWSVALKRNIIFLANSQYSRECFISATGWEGSIDVVYNPVATERFRVDENQRVSRNSLQIVYCGRLAKGKNLFVWLDCAKEILKQLPNTHFKIHGDGPLREELMAYSQKIGLPEKNLEFAGHKTDIEVAYQQADLLLFLSEYESFGNVVVESVLCGTPVIASNIPSMKEIFENYPDFLIDNMANPIPEVVHKIESIPHFKKLTYKAANEFRNRFSLDNHVEKLRDVYRNI